MDDLGSLFPMLLSAAKAGNPALVAALVLVIAVALARKLAPASWGLGSGTRLLALTFAGSFGVALVTAFTGGGALSWAVVVAAVKVAVMASGGYETFKRLLAPALRWLTAKVPVIGPWLSKLLPDPVAMKADAKKAGDAAVKAKPAEGVFGNSEDLE